MLLQVGSEFFASSVGHRNHIFYTHSLLHLATHAFSHYSHLQPLASRIDSRRCPSRTATHYYHIKLSHRWLETLVTSAFKRLLHLFQQRSQVATPRVKHLSIGHHRRHSLNVKPIHLIFKSRTINHLMRDVAIEQSKNVERLHHIGAVRTAQRHKSLQRNLFLHTHYAASNHLVGQILPLAIGIQHRQQ